jgi:hypothetical protein
MRGLGDALSIDSQALADDALIVAWKAAKVYADGQEPGVSVAIRLYNDLVTEGKIGQNGFDTGEPQCNN